MELVPVRVGDCSHPEIHSDPLLGDGDFAYLAPKPGLDMGVAAAQALASSDAGFRTVAMMLAFVRYGVKRTNWQDDLDIDEILADNDIASPIAAKGADLYSDAVMRPLLPGTSQPSNRAMRRSSSRGIKNGSTSPTPPSPKSSPASSSEASSGGVQ